MRCRAAEHRAAAERAVARQDSAQVLLAAQVYLGGRWRHGRVWTARSDLILHREALIGLIAEAHFGGCLDRRGQSHDLRCETHVLLSHRLAGLHEGTLLLVGQVLVQGSRTCVYLDFWLLRNLYECFSRLERGHLELLACHRLLARQVGGRWLLRLQVGQDYLARRLLMRIDHRGNLCRCTYINCDFLRLSGVGGWHCVRVR